MPSKILRAVIVDAMKNNAWKFMPKPGEILQYGKMDSDRDRKLKAKEAFQSLLKQARRGQYDPNLNGPSAIRAMRLVGGFSVFQNAEDTELQWLEKRFIESFELADEAKSLEGGVLQLVSALADRKALK